MKKIIFGDKRGINFKKSIVLVDITDPGETANNKEYMSGNYKKWLDRGGKDYPKDYVKDWKRLIEWVGNSDNAKASCSIGLNCDKGIKKELLSLYDELPEEKKWKSIELPTEKIAKLGEMLKTDRRRAVDEFMRLAIEKREETMLRNIGNRQVNNVVVFGAGEFALGCVSFSLNGYNGLGIPDRNIFIAHNFCVTPIPADEQYHDEYLREVGSGYDKKTGFGRHCAFNDIQSVFLDLENNCYKEYRVVED